MKRIPAWLREWIKRLRASVARRPAFAAVLLLVTLVSSHARADTPISKCWPSICAEPQVATTTLVYRPSADSLQVAFPAGAIGYGVRLPSGYASAGLFIDGAVGTGAAAHSYLGIALLLTVMRAVSVGPVLHLVGERWFGLALGWSATSAAGLEADKPAEKWE
jgi:hypothetical protein